jgi:hypothetical protein
MLPSPFASNPSNPPRAQRRGAPAREAVQTSPRRDIYAEAPPALSRESMGAVVAVVAQT